MIKKLLFFILIPVSLFSQKLNYNISIVNGQSTDLQLLKDGNITTGWFPGWNKGDYPVRALISLTEPSYVTKIRVYDWVGKPKLSIYSDNKKLVERELSLYGQWYEFEINSTSKLSEFIIQISDIQGDRPITEFEVYGTSVQPPPAPTPIKKFYADALKIGANGFHWIPTDLNPTPNLRMYQMAQWTWTPNGIAVDPTYQAEGNYDTYLQDSKDKTIIFCINKVPDWFANKSVGDEWSDQRFHRFGLNSTTPLSYLEFAEYVWQMTARYGSRQYPSNLLKVNKIPRWNGDVVNTEKSGLNLIKYIEFENETDRPWKQSPLYKYTPQELAAMLSAIWDGHEGTMGSYVGIKNADPKVKIVMPGLSNINIWYLSEMKRWFDQNRRDKQFCADVINVHHYSNSKNPWPGINVDLTGLGVDPQSDHLEYRLKELNQWCSQNVPKAEVWFSEFGYDTQYPSTGLSQFPKLYGNKTPVELQSQWLLQTYLISLASGMDKIFMFNLCDEDSWQSGYVFGSSGLLTSQSTGFKKKQSWNEVDWLVRNLNNYSFYKDRSMNGVTVYEFRNKLSSRFFYWSNSSPITFNIGSKQLISSDKVQVHTTTRLFNNTVVKTVNVKQ